VCRLEKDDDAAGLLGCHRQGLPEQEMVGEVAMEGMPGRWR
jgi:hypothetical protein